MRPLASLLVCAAFVAGAFTTFASCSSSDDSSATDSGTGDETAVRFDSGGSDSGGDDSSTTEEDSATSCQPVALATPPTYVPPRAQQAACSQDQIDGFKSSCLTSPTGAGCTTYKTANPTCYACLDSTSTDPTRGPIVYYANRAIGTLNVSGCFGLLLGDTSPNSCAAADELLRDCEEAACEVSCDVAHNTSNLTAFNACKKAAESTVCSSYLPADSNRCAGIIADASPVALCYGTSGETFAQRFNDLALLFCGAAPSDGGDGG